MLAVCTFVQGPFGAIPTVYITLLVVWTVFSFLWCWWVLVKEYSHSLPAAKLLSVVPLLRLAVMCTSTYFWVDCLHNGAMCLTLAVTPLFSLQHVMEAGEKWKICEYVK